VQVDSVKEALVEVVTGYPARTFKGFPVHLGESSLAGVVAHYQLNVCLEDSDGSGQRGKSVRGVFWKCTAWYHTAWHHTTWYDWGRVEGQLSLLWSGRAARVWCVVLSNQPQGGQMVRFSKPYHDDESGTLAVDIELDGDDSPEAIFDAMKGALEVAMPVINAPYN